MKGVEKWLDFGYILKVESRGFASEGMWNVSEREEPRLRNRIKGSAIYWHLEFLLRIKCVEENLEFCLDH